MTKELGIILSNAVPSHSINIYSPHTLNPQTFIVAVAKLPRIKLLCSENVLMFMGSGGPAIAAAAVGGATVVAGARDSSI